MVLLVVIILIDRLMGGAYSAFVLLFPFPSDVRQPRRFFGDGQDTVQ